jgi:NAD-reducing hydrogenase large subunit
MPRTLTIDPITRIEGHAKITLFLGEDGRIEDAHFHVTQLRGFEKFCEGRPFTEMPSLMARICGICPVSHLVASSKACDRILAVTIPEPAGNLRRIMNLAQIIQSHALSFFHLASPDLLLGMDSDPKKRNVFGVYEAEPRLAKAGIRLRQIGQTIIELLGGKRIHPAWVVPGGVSKPLSEEERDHILAFLPESYEIIRHTLDWFKSRLSDFQEEVRTFANFPSLFMGQISKDGGMEFYDGKLRIVNEKGKIVEDGIVHERFEEIIGEVAEPWTYLKFAYYKPMGYPAGSYRVGPLARLNVIDHCGHPRADEEWAEFRDLERGAILSSFQYHYARLIEILCCLEKMEKILRDPQITSKHVRAFAQPNNHSGIGISEAPRGTLMHHYEIDDNGLITRANLIIATGQNNAAMNRGVLQAAKHYVKNEKLQEGMLNRVEAVIRAFDPCLSCSTHAVGKMPFLIELVDRNGAKLDEIRRDSK